MERQVEQDRPWRIRDLAAEEAAWGVLGFRAAGRLAARVEEYGAPAVPYEPIYNRIAVYRFRPPPPVEKTVGGLFIPEVAREEPWPENRGLLLAAGLKAMEELRSCGIFVGDIVLFGAFEGEEKEYELDRSTNDREQKKKVLQLKNGGLFGSVDLKERLYGEKPSLKRVFVRDSLEDPGQYILVPIVEDGHGRIRTDRRREEV